MAGAKRLALPLMSSSDWKVCTYMRIEQYNNQYIFVPRAWVSAGQKHIIPHALIQHLGSQAGCSANFDFDIAVSKQIEYNLILWKDSQALFCYLPVCPHSTWAHAAISTLWKIMGRRTFRLSTYSHFANLAQWILIQKEKIYLGYHEGDCGYSTRSRQLQARLAHHLHFGRNWKSVLLVNLTSIFVYVERAAALCTVLVSGRL